MRFGVLALSLLIAAGASAQPPVRVDESVDVRADAEAARTAAGGLNARVDGPTAVALPLNGRSFVPLVALTPGVALPPGSAFPRINGGRPRTNEYLFDGISVLQPEPGQIAFLPIIDAIDEIRIERNSPPAEFGRFNGGVVNLTTKAGGDAFHGDAFEFLRHEALNARNLFATSTPDHPDTPRFRRQQFGGVAGGPIRKGHTFFFADFQGTVQTIGRVAISTVPTLLQRQGIFSETIGGRAPAVYDPATTAITGGGVFTRSPLPGQTIPLNRIDPAALALLQRYPVPTSTGTANNYRRVANELDSQQQIDGRIDERFNDRDHAFARLSLFHGDFTPVTPLPDGSGAIASSTTGPQQTRALALAGNYRRTVGAHGFNELRAGYTRRAVERHALDIPTVVVDGYQQLGSPANTRSDFRTDVTEIMDAFTWARGRHTWKAGLDFRWARLDVVQPPSPNGTYRFSSLFTDLPGTPNTGSPFASFLLGQVQTFSIDLQQKPIRPRAHIEEYFVQDDWKPRDRFTLTAGVRYTLNFPSTDADDQAAVFNLQTEQLEYLGRDGHPRSARELHKLNFGPRAGFSYRATDRTLVRGGYGLIWIEQTGITTPFTAPQFPFLQTVTERTLDGITPAFALASGPDVAPIPLTPNAGLGQGVFAVDRFARIRIRPAVERRGGASARLARVDRSRVRRLHHHARRHPRLKPEPAERGPARARLHTAAARAESILWTDPRVLVDRRSDDLARAAAQALSAVHHGQPVSPQRRHDELSRRRAQARTSVVARVVLPGQLHAVTADGRCLVGVRRVDPDGTAGQRAGGRRLQSRARA